MTVLVDPYPKFLAFLYLVYPDLYKTLASFSTKTDLVEAELTRFNNMDAYQAIIFSDGDTSSGEKFNVVFNDHFRTPYSWDWRWVFAITITYTNQTIFLLKFKQRVIALPTGKYALSNVFFNNLQDLFSKEIEKLITSSKKKNISIKENYKTYLNSTKSIQIDI